MARVQSEYEVESLFIERLTDMGYKFIPMKNYDDVLANFRKQLSRRRRSLRHVCPPQATAWRKTQTNTNRWEPALPRKGRAVSHTKELKEYHHG